ncbi:MAG: hypothetical protein DRR42_18195 [Gammaproteobacteria bacterium]|nr:MAG: hypothetical protein DRR42_18195 [Gammaproteobacteria bacterium]
MTEPIITTVIPTFRRPLLLRRAVESVLAQSFKNLVVCIYDNDSGDETEEVVKGLIKRDSRIIYFKNSQNIGGVANISQGLERVNTPYYSLLSDDDFLLPGFYENAVKALEIFPEARFICSKTVVIDLIDKKLQFRNQDWAPGVYEPSGEVVSKMHSSHFVTTGVLLSKDLRDSIGVFEPSGSDSLYTTIAAASFPFVVLDSYGAAVILHENAYSMLEGGAGKESISTLYENLLSSVDNVMKMNLLPEMKVHLLMQIMASYNQYFDIKKLNFLLSEAQVNEMKALAILPSFISARGLLTRVFSMVPRRIYLLLVSSIRLDRVVEKLTAFIKRIKHRLLGSRWIDLPEGAYSLLKSVDSDMLKLLPYLKRNK